MLELRLTSIIITGILFGFIVVLIIQEHDRLIKNVYERLRKKLSSSKYYFYFNDKKYYIDFFSGYWTYHIYEKEDDNTTQIYWNKYSIKFIGCRGTTIIADIHSCTKEKVLNFIPISKAGFSHQNTQTHNR